MIYVIRQYSSGALGEFGRSQQSPTSKATWGWPQQAGIPDVHVGHPSDAQCGKNQHSSDRHSL